MQNADKKRRNNNLFIVPALTISSPLRGEGRVRVYIYPFGHNYLPLQNPWTASSMSIHEPT
jgi:hypothetical protein